MKTLPWKKILLGLLLAGSASLFLGIVGVGAVFVYYGRDVAALDEKRLKNYRPPQVTRIYSRDEVLIGEIYTQRRTVLDYEDIPSHVENAFLAAEDADFYHHEGMDYFGMVRALIANVKAGEVRQGASTITQQVVKIFMLSPERTFERKVQELILARRLEAAFTKKEILELYLNEIYLGHGRYGIEEASRFYFGKSAADIDLGQAALLATLPKAPGRDSPLTNPARAKARQTYVLEQMVEHGFIKPEEGKRYIEAGLSLAAAEDRIRITGGAEEFVDAARRQMREHYGDETLDALGAKVITTVDLEVQQHARQAAIHGLRELDRRNGYGHGLKPASAKRREKVVQQGRSASLTLQRLIQGVVVAPPADSKLPEDGIAVQIGDTHAYVSVPKKSRYREDDKALSQQFPEGAIVTVRLARAPDGTSELPQGWWQAELAPGPEAAVIVTDTDTGEVVAMVGGSTYGDAQFNRAMQAKRQPGSTFKPFVYGAALASHRFTAATIVSDSPEIYDKWRPTNFKPDDYRGDIRLRVALTHSINTVAIKLIDQIGVEAVTTFARAAGIESPLPESLSLALGTGEVTPFELMRGYLTIARGGERIEPTFIVEVRVPGEEPYRPEHASEQAIPDDVAFVLTSMMQSVVQEGTGTKAKELGRPVAGKTGTSADYHDAWFAGFTPRHVAVAWVGFDKPQSLGRKETGGKAALPIWLGAMKAAEKGPAAAFVVPASVSVRQIDAASGLLAPTGAAASGYTGEILEEYFVAGTEPVEEAEPAALPATDVLLDLYGDQPSEGGPGQQPLSVAPTTPPSDAPRDGDNHLPSLDDVDVP